MSLESTNKEIANKFSKIGIKKINITAVGNSISSGYSMVHAIQPLLTYNKTLQEDIKGVEVYHFARAQDNCDAHIYRWLRDNYSLKDIYYMNRRDYGDTPELMPLALDENGKRVGMTKEKMEKYYPLSPKKNPRFKDLVTPQKDIANIIIYNGATGSFLDNITRQGPHKLTHGIKKDICAVESFMQEITILNERYCQYEPTQVYLCGAPKLLFSIEKTINKKLQDIVKRHPQITYVDSVRTHIFKKCDNGKTGIDPFHYSTEEYQRFNLNIMNTINNHYIINRSVVKTAAQLKQANNHLFYTLDDALETPSSKELCANYFDAIIEEQLKTLESLGGNHNQYLDQMRTEIKENRAHEYYTLTKTIEPQKRLEKMKNR